MTKKSTEAVAGKWLLSDLSKVRLSSSKLPAIVKSDTKSSIASTVLKAPSNLSKVCIVKVSSGFALVGFFSTRSSKLILRAPSAKGL